MAQQHPKTDFLNARQFAESCVAVYLHVWNHDRTGEDETELHELGLQSVQAYGQMLSRAENPYSIDFFIFPQIVEDDPMEPEVSE